MQHIELRQTWLRPEVLWASLGINLLGLALPLVILQIYDRVLRDHALSTLGYLVAMTVVAFVLEFALRILRSSVLSAVGSRYDHRTTVSNLAHLLQVDIQSFKRDTPATHAERFQAIQQVRQFYAQQALLLLTDLPFAIIFLVLIGFIAGWLVLVPLTFFVAFIAAAYVLSRALGAVMDERDQADTKRHNFLIESLTGIKTIKALTLESALQRRHERLQEASADAFARITRITADAQGLSAGFAQAATVATVGFGAIAVVQGGLTVGGLAATTILTGRLLQPVIRGLSTWTRYEAIRIAERKILKLEELPADHRGSAVPRPEVLSALRLRDVSYTYPGKTTPLLSHVDLIVPPRALIGITGPTASGRTTLLNLMAGLLRPSEGSVILDGQSIDAYALSDYRRHVALLSTSPTIYRGTVLENLTAFADGPVRERALQIARLIGLEPYIASLSEGLDTRIGGGDVLVPTGIAQRIAIVRALAQDPRIVLFDNANAGFDQQADEAFKRFLERIKGRRTIVLATDRPSYLALCQKVYVLKAGRLEEMAVPAPLALSAEPLADTRGAA